MSDFGIFRGFSIKLFEGQAPVDLGLIGSYSVSDYLLDTYTGAAAAYSLRLLSSTYTGDAIRVRRASDNAETNIGFIGAALDISTLASFCSGTNGYVVTWYDQSGNGYDATQNTANYQPQIVSSGSIIYKNGYPCIYGDGVSHRFEVTINDFPSGDINIDVFMIDHLIGASNGLSSSTIGAESYVQDRRIITTLCNEGTNNAVRVYGGNSVYNENFTEYRLHNINYQSGGGAVNARVNNQALTIQSSTTGTLNFQSTSRITMFGVTTTLVIPHETYIQEAIYYFQNKSTDRLNIMSNINSYHNIYWDGSQTSLLDTYGGSAAAYSLRALSSSYTGALIKVRRASDNAEQDIYAKYDGTLNTDALESFCSGTNGFVTTWYDQSGNDYNATQTTSAYQPQIVSSGSTILENGKPAVDFDGTDDNFSVWNNTTAPTLFQDMSDAITLISVEKANTISNSGSVWFNGNTSAEIRINNTSAHVTFSVGYSNNQSGFGVTDDYISGAEKELSGTLSIAQRLTTRYINGDNLDVYINNSSAISTTFTVATGDRSVSTNASTFSIGSRSRDGGQIDNSLYRGTMQEIVLWKSNLGADENGISTNINDFYSIY